MAARQSVPRHRCSSRAAVNARSGPTRTAVATRSSATSTAQSPSGAARRARARSVMTTRPPLATRPSSSMRPCAIRASWSRRHRCPGASEHRVGDRIGSHRIEGLAFGLLEHDQRIAVAHRADGDHVLSRDARTRRSERAQRLVLDLPEAARRHLWPRVPVPHHAPEPSHELRVAGVSAVDLHEQRTSRGVGGLVHRDAGHLRLGGLERTDGEAELGEARADPALRREARVGTDDEIDERRDQDADRRGRERARERALARGRRPRARRR